MKQAFIKIDDLKISPLNVRKHGDTGGEDLIPSIRANGVIQPLLVRKNCQGYEVLAGQRRYNAALSIAAEEDLEPIPCLIMEEGDDAAAIAASLAENIARLPMDELDQYEAFRALSKAGQSVEEIAFAFGVTERMVQQRLALANLHPPILNAYRREEVRANDLRSLTMATRKQQKAWWKLQTSKDECAPTGYRLKSWLFGGDQIPVSNALFDLNSYKGAIVSDLFEEERYFGDSAIFWQHQSKAIADLVADYRQEGWASVVVHDVGERWYHWTCVKLSQEDGGEVHITCADNGEIEVFAGYLDEKTYRKRQKAEEAGEDRTSTRPELTKPMQNYLGLHRHSAVRTELLQQQGIALRLMLAQVIAGAHADGQYALKEATTESLNANKAEAPFLAERSEVRALLGLGGEPTQTLLRTRDEWDRGLDPYTVFAKLLGLSDETVMRVLTFVTAEILPSNDRFVEILGVLLQVDMKSYWSPDETFFDLFKDKEAINAALADCASEAVAKAHTASTAKAQKSILQKCLSGEREDGNKDWQPAYMAFPMQAYTQRGGLEAVTHWDAIKDLFEAA